MRGLSRILALLLLVSGLASAQGVPGPLTPCKLDGSDCAPATGTVTTTGTLAADQIARGSGATSITGDAGLTGVGTGTGFKLGIGTDVFISRASAGTLLVEDGAGNARDVQARTGTFGTSVVTPVIDPGGGTLLMKQASGVVQVVLSGATLQPYADAGTNLGVDGLRWYGVWGYTGNFGTSVVTPTVLVGDGTIANPSLAESAYPTNGFSFGQYALTYSFAGGQAWQVDSNATMRLGAVGNQVVLGRQASDVTRFGEGPTGTPVSQTIEGSGSRGGTDTNVAGGSLTIRPGAGTGSAAGSSLVFQTPSAGASGTGAQTQTTRLTLSEPAVIAAVPVRLAGYTVATLPAGTVGDTAYVTDATAPTYLGALTGGGAVVCPVIYNGSAWVSH